jgi:hypothetical protein
MIMLGNAAAQTAMHSVAEALSNNVLEYKVKCWKKFPSLAATSAL